MRFAPIALALALLAPTAAVAMDEAPSRTQQSIQLGGKTLRYVAEASRLEVTDARGKPLGKVFFTAYRVPSSKPRPVTFIWNGGPGSASTLLHLEAFGPRRIEGGKLTDNPATLLPVSDLVFVDPIGTGFSRAADPAAASVAYSTTGDLAATASFVQRFRERYLADAGPVFLVGESYGVWRAAGTAELLERRGVPVAGIVLISGGVGLGETLLRPLGAALRVPNRTAAALFHGRLDPALGKDRDAAVKASEAWARATYAPALEHPDALSAAEKDAVAKDVQRYTGFPADAVDRKTLAVTPRQYLTGLLKDEGKTLNTFDMRIAGEAREGSGDLILRYFRKDLAYDVAGPRFVGLEAQTPDDDKRPVNARWNYNSGEITPEVMARAQAGEGPPGAEPWTARALAINPNMRVLVAAGLYDSLNSCAANRELERRLDPAIKGAFHFGCYLGGHMMYRDAEARAQLSRDVKAFIGRGG